MAKDPIGVKVKVITPSSYLAPNLRAITPPSVAGDEIEVLAGGYAEGLVADGHLAFIDEGSALKAKKPVAAPESPPMQVTTPVPAPAEVKPVKK